MNHSKPITRTVKSTVTIPLITVLLVLAFAVLPMFSDAQKLRHGGGGGGGNRQLSRPSGGNRQSINGGSQRAPNRNMGNFRGNNNIGDDNRRGNNNIGSNNRGGGNRLDIDKSKRNVNVNIDNSKHVNISNRRNTIVRSNRMAYIRPPYRYGGRAFFCYHPYFYHPFRPFYWGPVWHPWGFFLTTLAATAIIVSVENQQYHYDQGVYYVQSNGGYTAVEAPVGATIKTLPANSQTVVVNETTNNYYYGGTYYEKGSDGYKVVPPTAGTTVENLPEGAKEVKVGDQTYVQYGETYYLPVQVNGKNMYEVADVKTDDKK